jgi:mannosyltransferase OCH1-like enzyme
MKLLKIITLLILIIISILSIEYYKIYKETFEINTSIPKKIWTYWDNDRLPEIIEKCINTWKKHNPNYEIIVLSKQNLL